MSVVSLVRWGVRNPRPEQRVSKNLSFETGFDQMSGDNVLPFPDRTAFRIPPGGIPQPDDPSELPSDELSGSFILRRLVLGAVTLAAIAAAFVAGMISTALAKDSRDTASAPPLAGLISVQVETNPIWDFDVPERAADDELPEGQNLEIEMLQPEYYGALPNWDSVQMAQVQTDTSGSATAVAEPDEDNGVSFVSGTRFLAPHLKQKILLDPKVEEARARVCQMVHRLGLAKAGARPQLSASISGSRQIVGRIKRDPGASGLFRRTTPQQQEIHESGAHRREFNHRQENNIYDGKLTLRHRVIDWGQNRNRIEAGKLRHEVARIDAVGVLGERSHEVLRLALVLERLNAVIDVHQTNFDLVKREVDAVRARFEAGAGRLSDLREAQLVALDQEILINRAMAERDQVVEHLETEYDFRVEEAADLAVVFFLNRPVDLTILPADRTDKAHALRLRIRQVDYEAAEIRGSRYPQFDAVIEGTIFDMTDYEDEYEVVGKLEMKVPLYDGGTARARLRETAWRSRELRSSIDALVRVHDREMEGLAQRFTQLQREETEALARRDELRARYRSLRERQGQTVSSPLAVARLQAEIGGALARLTEIRSDREIVRARALFVAEQLDVILGLSLEESSC